MQKQPLFITIWLILLCLYPSSYFNSPKMQKPPFLKTIWFLLVWDRKKKCVSYFPAIASHSGAEKLTATISQGRQIKIHLTLHCRNTRCSTTFKYGMDLKTEKKPCQNVKTTHILAANVSPLNESSHNCWVLQHWKTDFENNVVWPWACDWGVYAKRGPLSC